MSKLRISPGFSANVSWRCISIFVGCGIKFDAGKLGHSHVDRKWLWWRGEVGRSCCQGWSVPLKWTFHHLRDKKTQNKTRQRSTPSSHASAYPAKPERNSNLCLCFLCGSVQIIVWIHLLPSGLNIKNLWEEARMRKSWLEDQHAMFFSENQRTTALTCCYCSCVWEGVSFLSVCKNIQLSKEEFSPASVLWPTGMYNKLTIPVLLIISAAFETSSSKTLLPDNYLTQTATNPVGMWYS